MQYKMKDVLPVEDAEKEEDCELCKTHELAYKVIPEGVVCPCCNHNNEYPTMEYTIVGQTNGYDPEDRIDKYRVFRCEECNEYIAMMPEKIMYNGNHDIYYTGGKDYLLDEDEDNIFKEAEQKIKESLDQWVRRYEAGEKLDTFYPALWMKRNVTHAIAEYLHKKGLKK